MMLVKRNLEHIMRCLYVLITDKSLATIIRMFSFHRDPTHRSTKRKLPIRRYVFNVLFNPCEDSQTAEETGSRSTLLLSVHNER